jgi:hypothetical protein
MKHKQPSGPPMTLGNMRELGVLGLGVQAESVSFWATGNRCSLSGELPAGCAESLVFGGSAGAIGKQRYYQPTFI